MQRDDWALRVAASLAAAVIFSATLTGGAVGAFADDDDDSVYTADFVADDYEDQIVRQVQVLKKAKDEATVLRALSAMSEAVGINNPEGEMNVFSPSFRRTIATDLYDVKHAPETSPIFGSQTVQDFYGFLKRQMDPYHTIELKGYLSIAPFVGALAYGALLLCQRFASELFTLAYIGAAALVLGPIALIYFFF